MIIAACTFRVDPQSRSRSIASVISAIARAGGLLPAPDLIVLPDCFCDAPGAPAAPRASAAMCIGFRETVARAAREWGVWIAAGHARVMPAGIAPGASVFDPDGDAWLRYPSALSAMEEIDASAWSVRPTPLGRWALCLEGALVEDELLLPATDAQLAIIPAHPDAAQYSLKDLADAAGLAECAICLARAQLDDKPVASGGMNVAIVARNGTVLASAPNGVVVAEVDVPACAPQAYMEDSEHIE